MLTVSKRIFPATLSLRLPGNISFGSFSTVGNQWSERNKSYILKSRHHISDYSIKKNLSILILLSVNNRKKEQFGKFAQIYASNTSFWHVNKPYINRFLYIIQFFVPIISKRELGPSLDNSLAQCSGSNNCYWLLKEKKRTKA